MARAELFVTDVGSGPPVVLLHGLTATQRYVVMGSRSLERSGHRVVAYDARGHGASGPGDTYTYAALTDDLRWVLDDRDIGRAVLVGSSMGAHTLLRLALEDPQRVAAMVVITPAHHEDATTDLERWDALADGLRTGGVEGFVGAYGEPTGEWAQTIVKVLRQRLSAHEHPGAVADALEQVPRSEPFSTVADLTALPDVPTLIVADRDGADPGHPLWVGEAYASAIPAARLLVEDEGDSPLAWQGGRLSKHIASLVGEVQW